MVKVETIAGSRLRVWLTDKELEKWGILPQDRPDSRQNARRLVRRALHIARWHPAATLLAEVFPVDGGCIMLLSVPAKEEDGLAPTVYRLADADILCALAERWCRLPPEQGGMPGIVLCEREEGYDLAVSPVELLSDPRRRLLEEYGRRVGVGQAAVAAAAEYGRVLGTGNVLERLGLTEPVPLPPAAGDRPH